MTEKKSIAKNLVNILSSKYFFRFILVVFFIEASWIALSSVYPMAFDENFHLGIIRLYASHISPFWAHQPKGADPYGAVNRDPSYLYQYLMSFAYRLVTLFTQKASVIVILLRFINIALFSWGIYLFRKLLRKTGAEEHKINFTLLIFILIPVVPLLAGQINYDNLVFPLVALSLILTINLVDKIINKKKIDSVLLLELTILCLLASIVKYAYLPIAAVIGLYIIYVAKKNIGLNTKLIQAFKKDWRQVRVYTKSLLVLGVIGSAILFSQRYVVNLVDYGSPIPDCNKVLTFNACKQYGPWARDYNYTLSKVDTDADNEKHVLTFTADWFYGMWLRTFFALAGPDQDYQTRGPLPVPAFGAVAFAAIGLIATIVTYKKILKRYNAHNILFLVLASGFYCFALWFDEFRSFIETGQAVAINGRYLFPILPVVILVLVLGLSNLLKNYDRLKASLAVVCIICLILGGGLLTFIIRSQDNWYWNSALVRNVNNAIRNVTKPIVPGSNDPILYL